MEQNQARVVDREMRENEVCEKFMMKREKGNGVVSNMNGDNSFGNLVQPIGYDKCLKVFKNGNYCGDVNLGHRNQSVVPNGLIERSSSVLLDYQSTSQKAGSSSTDTGSHSNYSQGGQQQLIATASSDNPARSVLNCPSSHGRPDQANGKSPNLLLTMASSNIPSHECTDSQTCEPTTKKLKRMPKEQPSFDYRKCNEPVINPPIPQTSNQETAPLRRMPLVSTTGNGPNGKTANGFLYNYSKSEVMQINN